MQFFINLSNHPSSGWSEKQLTEARRIGHVIDLPFPDVDPERDDVDELAKQFVSDNFSDMDGKNVVVHIMGEMTFTYNVVLRLVNMGIRCVASTTRRVVEEKDGKKISTFEFIKFRAY